MVGGETDSLLLPLITELVLVPIFTMVQRLQKGSKQRGKRTRDNILSQIHHNDTLRKGKATALNSAAIKIVRTVTESTAEASQG